MTRKARSCLDIFGETFDCSCGRRHSIEPRQIVYADDAIDRLAAICAPLSPSHQAAVLMDARTARAAGNAAVKALEAAKWRIAEVLVPDRTRGRSPICDDTTKARLEKAIPSAEMLIAVGSGVVNDLAKWIAHDRGVPYVVFATAASMNGYTSANIAPTLAGVKSLLDGSPPAAVLSSAEVLRGAPPEMTAAGLGDVLAKSISSADWRLNHALFGEYYCDRAVGLIGEIEPLYFEHPRDIASRKPRAVEALFHALLLTGAAMTMAGTSAPSSGGEHMISHTLDMMSSVDGTEHDLHGRQVGVGTVLAAEVYRRVLSQRRPAFKGPRDVDRAFWGQLAQSVAAQYAQKLEKYGRAAERLAATAEWEQLREVLGPMPRPPEAIHDCLQAAGAACRASDIQCNRARLLAALRHAHEIRSRFTILDLAHLTGVLPEQAEDIVEQWG